MALATLYYTAQVAGQARGTEETKRRDISRFLAFYYDLLRHYHPRDWLQERGGTPGPLFTTARGQRLERKQLYEVLKRVERQANAHLPEKERFTVSPHVLRHTFLRKLAETKGVQYAKEASGHKTDRYIWRYVKPDQQTLAEAVDGLG